MKPSAQRPPREDVLDAFAVEQDIGRETLERYLRDYPEYAAALLDLSHELSRRVVENDGPVSAEDEKLIEKAWQRHTTAAPMKAIDPFAVLSTADWRKVAEHLGLPRQVVTAFRERRVEVGSVPRRFLEQFASAVNCTIDKLVLAMELTPAPSLARSYKADSKPKAIKAVPFEQVLIDAGVPAEKRAILMAGEP